MILIALIVLIGVIADLIIILLAKTLPKREESNIKVLRYESGNLPAEKPKYELPFQYVPYLILFLSIEPIAVIILLLSPLENFLKIFVIALILIIPPLLGGVRLVKGVGD